MSNTTPERFHLSANLTTWRSAIAAWLGRNLGSLCLLCQLPCPGHRDLCSDCAQQLPWSDHEPRLSVPAPCLTDVVAALRYEPPVSYWIQQLKFQRSLVHGRLLSQLLCTWLERQCIETRGVIVPMPLHGLRLRWRGLNQARVLAVPVARRYGLQLDESRLRRSRWRPPQHRLPRAKRIANLDNTFTCHAWRGQHVILVDDVVTSGATAQAAAHACLAAGAARVDLWCAAHTPAGYTG